MINYYKKIREEEKSIKECLKAAVDAYKKCVPQKPSGYVVHRAVFCLFRSITAKGKTYKVAPGSVEEKIFCEAVENFKYSVQNFTNGAVHIEYEIKQFYDNYSCSDYDALTYNDAADVLKNLAPVGAFDSVFVVHSDGPKRGGLTFSRILNHSYYTGSRLFGFSTCMISCETDAGSVGKRYSLRYPYLVTTNIFIHEWLHQLEGYRDVIKADDRNIIYPYTHVYYEKHSEYNDSYEPWTYQKNYRWDKHYFDDHRRYPNVVERELTSFYRAVLACDVYYLPENRMVGMYPEFWRLAPIKLCVGRYLIRDNNLGYKFSNGAQAAGHSERLIGGEKYYWELIFQIDGEKLRPVITNCADRGYIHPFYGNCAYIRIGPYFTCDHYFVNKHTGGILTMTSANEPVLKERKSSRSVFLLRNFISCLCQIIYIDNNNERRLLTFLGGGEVRFMADDGDINSHLWQIRFHGGTFEIVACNNTSQALSFSGGRLCTVRADGNGEWMIFEYE